MNESATRRLVDLVEAAAVGEMGLRRLLPAAEDFVDGGQLDRGESPGVLRRDFLVDRPVVVAAGDVLAPSEYR